jgi:large subunit ribosomal protein L28
MAKICDICGKGYLKANKVPRGIGNRVTNRSITRKGPNLRSKKLKVGGSTIKVKICSSCLKRLKFEQKQMETAESTVEKAVDSKTETATE